MVAESIHINTGIPLERIKQHHEEAAAEKKKSGKTYRDNAKENHRKRAEAAQAAAQAEERKIRCLVEGNEEAMEALDYEARPTMIKGAMNGEFVKATTDRYFVTVHKETPSLGEDEVCGPP